MYPKYLINRPSHKFARSKLRNNPTSAEYLLWQKLKHKQLGLWFKLQVSINKFIVDFYCPQKRLIFELDGEIHLQRKNSDYDKQRDWYLNSINFKILRFRNAEIFDNILNVIKKIKRGLRTRSKKRL